MRGGGGIFLDNKKVALMTVLSASEIAQNPVLSTGEFGFDVENKLLKIGDGNSNWSQLQAFVAYNINPNFAAASWEEIAELSKIGKASQYFRVGDQKTITLTTGKEIKLVILGFDHDDLTSGGKAQITLGTVDLVSFSRMYATPGASDLNNWDKCEMRTNQMKSLLDILPADLQNIIKTVNKKANAGGTSNDIIISQDKLWLFSEVEIDGTTADIYKDEGVQYEYWRTVKDGTLATDRIKKLDSYNYSWWLRSSSSFSTFKNIGNTGTLQESAATQNLCISFGFCI